MDCRVNKRKERKGVHHGAEYSMEEEGVECGGGVQEGRRGEVMNNNEDSG